MTHTERRNRLRELIAGNQCLSPASVYDALSARVAKSVGYEIGMLAGSVASNTTLGAPDLIVLTMTEFADQIRRITRASDLSLIVDADHGYGNALNVMRTVEECEHSGVSAMSIEDTYLPTRYGNSGGEELISIPEGVGKMKAALAARSDPSLVIAGRTSALKVEGVEGTLARAKAYAEAGVDAIFLVGVETIEHVQAVHDALAGRVRGPVAAYLPGAWLPHCVVATGRAAAAFAALQPVEPVRARIVDVEVAD